MSKGTMHRTFRAEDELWLPAKAKAEAEGANLSDVLREALRQYVTQPPPPESSSAYPAAQP